MKNLRKLFVLIVSVAIVFTSCTTLGTEAQDTERIGIITAMSSELQLLLDNAEIERTETIGGVDYHVGTLSGKDVVLVKGGVGKSLSASGATILIHEFDVDKVIFTGIAGGVADETDVLDMVISTDCIMHDYGDIGQEGFIWEAMRNTGDEGRIPADEDLVEAAYEAAVEVVGADHAFKGTVVTGDQFVASEWYVQELQDRFNAYATEMEGASVAYVCQQYGVPFVVIRCMSDKADGLAHDSVTNFGSRAADQSGSIVMTMLETL